MLIRYWQPITNVDRIRHQLDKVMRQELSETPHPSPATYNPAIELIDGGENLILRVQLPGIERQNIDVQVTKDMVSITADSLTLPLETPQKTLYSEFHSGKFQRRLRLPVPIQNQQVQADFTNGILTLTLPKVAAQRNQVVKINLGAAAPTSSPDAAD